MSDRSTGRKPGQVANKGKKSMKDRSQRDAERMPDDMRRDADRMGSGMKREGDRMNSAARRDARVERDDMQDAARRTKERLGK
ncbi:hypothetical protein [Nocardia wallacei]|uniref:Uncharacterized protein n=1 Tax=Nocardia wallacei TaxID=480035 RepID=A0A7G1KEZ4_9NOCA|nr:hypothetical protein [Nocardia wallacei]BCK53842.1 hypothetical protein NWFMUON74_16140 [Nocardia wallacei]